MNFELRGVKPEFFGEVPYGEERHIREMRRTAVAEEAVSP